MRTAARVAPGFAGLALLAASLQAQLIPAGSALPRTGKPPVVFVNGYQGSCSASPGDASSFRGTFGSADAVLQANSQASVFFDNCTVANKPSITVLGNSLGSFLRGLRFADGQAVSEVDVVAHSMGGLIVRSYVAGRQTDGSFLPPATTLIRKIVFLGTPHFGSPAADLLIPPDSQTRDLLVFSRFVTDLATWNQGVEDLRGIDAVTVLGNAGNAVLGGRPRFHDSTVTLSSGSLDFVATGRTRIVNYCHTSGIAEAVCSGSAGFLAQMNSADHLSARVMTSFLNGSDDWRTVGESAEGNSFLSAGGGLAVQARDSADRQLTITAGTVTGVGSLSIRASEIAYSDYLPRLNLAVALSAVGGPVMGSLAAYGGGTRAVTLKSGPFIAAVYPVFAAVSPRSLAPGMFISIYGTGLSDTSQAAASQPYPTSLAGVEVRLGGNLLPLHFVGPTQINAVLPEGVIGLLRLQVRGPGGEHTVNVVFEPAVPTLHSSALNAVTGVPIGAAAPLRGGDFIAIYLTGLGATERRGELDWAVVAPAVTIGGKACELQYAGRAPGFSGLDQINCRAALDTPRGDVVAVAVRSGSKNSNTLNLVVR